jgi:hypothetical protein
MTARAAGLWGRALGVNSRRFLMTVRTRSDRIARRRGLSRWAAVVSALAVLLIAPAALAAVPMCGDHGQTIEAPLPIFPAKGGEIRATPDCDAGLARLLQAPVGEAPKLQTSGSGLERVLPLASVLPPLPVGQRLPVGAQAPGSPRQGFDSGIYRPPRG